MAQKIQFRRDTAANWTSVNPILSQGELGYETDTRKFKIGTGSGYWQELSYFSGGANQFSQLLGQIGETQIPTGQNAIVIPSHIRATNYASAGQVLSIDNIGQFEWITLTGGGGAPLATVATTGNYDDLTHKPTFTLGNLRTTLTTVSAGSFAEGSTYVILNPGNTNFTLIGAANNNPLTTFTATGPGTGSGTARLRGRFAVALTGDYNDLIGVPTGLSAFTDDIGYLSTLTLLNYVTTSQAIQIVGTQIDAAIGSSGTFYTVLQELASASTNTSVTTALANRLRVDINTQNLSSQQKFNAYRNMGLAAVSTSGSYLDLTDLPASFEVQKATPYVLGGIIVGDGLTVDNNGRLSTNTATTIIEMVGPSYNNGTTPSLKGKLNQIAGQLRADQDYAYLVTSNFDPSGFVTNQAATSNTNVISTIASQWLALIDGAKATYTSGQWSIFNTSKTIEYPVTTITTSAGIAYFTISDPTGVTYTSGQQFYVQRTDTVNRIAVMDSYGASMQSITGTAPTSVAGTVTLPTGQQSGTTSTLMTIDCTDVTYGELALSFTDSVNTEYYKGVLEVHIYPDNTYIIQPNLSGNKTDKIAVGFSSGINAPWTNTSAIKIPVYSTDINVQTLLTQSTATITNIKYSWILRSNI
jgi:hypothetical protein